MYEALNPIIRAEVRVFLHARRLQELDTEAAEDLVHTIWVDLLKDDRAELRRWDPNRASMSHFVRIKCRSKLKDRKRKHDGRRCIAPMSPLLEDVRTDRNTPDDVVESAQLGTKIDTCVRRRLGDRPLHVRLYEEEFLRGCDDALVEAALDIDRAKHYRMRHVIAGALRACWESVRAAP